MANMNVTYADMTTAALRLDAGKNDIISKLTELQSQVNDLVNSGFVTDSASGAFHESYQSFTTGTTQAVNGLDGMVSFLKGAADTLAQVDQQLAAGISGS